MNGIRFASCSALISQSIHIIAGPSLFPRNWLWVDFALAIGSAALGVYVLFKGTEA